ncbi:Corticotropin-releasing factor receptor 2 [Aphelenchoides bicaudatus]|nr:Corticotropin-releasing factor receptor 2 [Aphelenchoides bicaudatus]
MSLTFRENNTCNDLLLEHRSSLIASSSRCPPDFDRSLCWPDAAFGEYSTRECPFTFCTAVEGCAEIAQTYLARRFCSSSGWNDSSYSQCLIILKKHQSCVAGYCKQCPDLVREYVMNVSLVLSVISVALLVAALILFSLFDSIQCRRLSIHKNLAFAFVFRFAVLALWNVTNTTNAFRDCSNYYPIPLKSLEWLCKTILWLVIYFQVASTIWMLIEGVYLLSRFTVMAMRGEAPYYVYLLSGWGFPFVIVLVWTVIHEQHSSANGLFCWTPFTSGHHLWLLVITMGSALLLNAAVLLAIVIILIQKLKSENTAESKKIWKTIKATILLVPLLGISNIPLFYEPENPSSTYMLLSAILQNSQGIFIAFLYCFLNSEVQGAIRRRLSKVPFASVRNRLSHRIRFETERTYVPTTDSNVVNQRHGVQMEELNNRTNESPTANNNSYTNPSANSPQTIVPNGQEW